MAYSDFTLKEIKKRFNLQIEEKISLFPQSEEKQPTEFLLKLLEQWIPLAHAIGTEKARSEFIIAPVLAALWQECNQSVSLFSGVSFNVEPEQGLVGICDFILSLSKEQLALTAPILAVVEAKNENLNQGIPQCIAEILAAQIFNERENVILPCVYGCVTTGTLWKFLKYENNVLYVDADDYYIRETSRLWGVLTNIANTNII